jgi:rhodanese-related sulfurtransferase
MAKEIDVSQLSAMVKDGIELVDVREGEEIFRYGKIENSQHWPLSSFALREGEVSKTRPTIFYCHSGLRSLKAAEIASAWTKQEVYSLHGGYLAYLAEKKLKHPQFQGK